MENICWTVKNIPSLEFDCTVRNITNLDFSIYVSFCVSSCSFKKDINQFSHELQISAALEFPADLLSIVGLEWLGRRFLTSNSQERNQAFVSQVVSCPFHVGCWSDHLALCLAYRPTHASGNPCHGWKILCHVRHEHWLSVWSRGDLSKDNWRNLFFPGVSYHPERPGYGSGPSDVNGGSGCITFHRLLGELLLLGQLNCRRWLLFLRASCQRRLHGSSYHWLPSLPASQVGTQPLQILFGQSKTKLQASKFCFIILGLFLPETAGVNLPDTLESMKTFGK